MIMDRDGSVYPRVEIDQWGTLIIKTPHAGGEVRIAVGQYTAKLVLGVGGFLDIEVKAGVALPVSRIRVFTYDGTIVVN